MWLLFRSNESGYYFEYICARESINGDLRRSTNS